MDYCKAYGQDGCTSSLWVYEPKHIQGPIINTQKS